MLLTDVVCYIQVMVGNKLPLEVTLAVTMGSLWVTMTFTNIY